MEASWQGLIYSIKVAHKLGPKFPNTPVSRKKDKRAAAVSMKKKK